MRALTMDEVEVVGGMRELTAEEIEMVGGGVIMVQAMGCLLGASVGMYAYGMNWAMGGSGSYWGLGLTGMGSCIGGAISPLSAVEAVWTFNAGIAFGTAVAAVDSD